MAAPLSLPSASGVSPVKPECTLSSRSGSYPTSRVLPMCVAITWSQPSHGLEAPNPPSPPIEDPCAISLPQTFTIVVPRYLQGVGSRPHECSVPCMKRCRTMHTGSPWPLDLQFPLIEDYILPNSSSIWLPPCIENTIFDLWLVEPTGGLEIQG